MAYATFGIYKKFPKSKPIMKKLLPLFMLLLLFLSVQAQEQNIRFGFQLSPTIGWLSTNDNLINANGPNLGLKLGMTGDVYFQENYAITSGIGFYFNAGGTLFFEESVDSLNIWTEVDIPNFEGPYRGGTDFKYSLQFVEIPIGLKLRTREFGYIRYYLQPEMTIGFRTQARGQVENVTEIDPDEKYDISSATNILNLSWGIGGGIEYNISTTTSLVGGLAFQSGFADVTRDRNTEIYRPNRNGAVQQEDSRGRVNAIILRIGIIF